MVSLTADLVGDAGAGPEQGTLASGNREGHWSLLNQLENTGIGARLSDGSTQVRRREPGGGILYGPYLHLPAGAYRLSFRCRIGGGRMTAQPVLGVETIVLSRFQLAWADFTAGDLEDGGGSLVFEVPPEHSLEGDNEGRFEFRFFHFGNADLAITAVELERLCDEAPPADGPRQWRLLGRLSKSWLGRRRDEGSVTVSGQAPAGCLLYGGWPYLRLSRGEYRLALRCRSRAPRGAGGPRGGGGGKWLGSRYWGTAAGKTARAGVCWHGCPSRRACRTRSGILPRQQLPTASRRSISPCRPSSASRPAPMRRSRSGSCISAMRHSTLRRSISLSSAMTNRRPGTSRHRDCHHLAGVGS